MSAKHTPGPWSFRANYNGTLDFFGNDGATAILCGVRLINQEANARLIAASPRMAAALQRAAHILAELPPAEQTPRMLSIRLEIVEAIKQATPEYSGFDMDAIDAENLRHAQSLCRLPERETALKDAIIKLGAKPC